MCLIYSEFNQLLDEPGSGGGDRAYFHHMASCTQVLIVFTQILSSAESCSVPDKDLCSVL